MRALHAIPLMIALLANVAAQTGDAQTGLGIIRMDDATESRVYPQRGSAVPVRLGFPLVIEAGEIDSVVTRKRTSWNIISPSRTEYWLELELRPDAASRLNAFSPDGSDVRLGLLVRGEVVGAMVIRGPITGRKVALYGFGSREAVKSLADEIKTALRPKR